MRNFIGSFFHNVRLEGFRNAAESFLCTLRPEGIFFGDNLLTWSKNLSFLENERLMAALERHTEEEWEQSLVWRTAVLAWAARRALRQSGDFVECGAYKGTTARILCDYLDFGSLPRRYYLYDLFEHTSDM